MAILLLPASALLLTVLVLPVLQRRWAVVIYTCAVALLGTFLYAALQLVRRTGAASFSHNEAIANERWSPGTLATCLALLPSMLAGLGIAVYWHTAAAVAAAAAACIACVLGVALWAVVLRLLRDEGVGLGADGVHLLTIPEDSSPRLSTFLRDAAGADAPAGDLEEGGTAAAAR